MAVTVHLASKPLRMPAYYAWLGFLCLAAVFVRTEFDLLVMSAAVVFVVLYFTETFNHQHIDRFHELNESHPIHLSVDEHRALIGLVCSVYETIKQIKKAGIDQESEAAIKLGDKMLELHESSIEQCLIILGLDYSVKPILEKLSNDKNG